MREIFLGIVIGCILLYGLTSAVRSNIGFNILTFLRPFNFSSGALRSAPIWKFSLLLNLLVNVVSGNFKIKMPLFLMVFLLFLGHLAVSCHFGLSAYLSWEWFNTYTLSFVPVSVVLFMTVNRLDHLKWILWAMAGSIGLLAFKVGLSLTLRGGGYLSEATDGFVGDNNVLALTICLMFPILLGLRTSIGSKKFLYGFYFALSMMFMTVIYTKSRGAFLSIAVICLTGVISSRNRIRNFLILLGLAAAAYLIIPKDYFSRMDTLSNVEEDESAMGRIVNWKVAFEAANRYPVFGVGLDNFRTYKEIYHSYMGAELRLVTHSVYFQTLAETGYPGLMLYLLMLLLTLMSLQKTYSMANRNLAAHPDLLWVSRTAFWMRNGFIGFIFGSGFLNILLFDGPTYFMFYANMLPRLLEEELKERENGALQSTSSI